MKNLDKLLSIASRGRTFTVRIQDREGFSIYPIHSAVLRKDLGDADSQPDPESASPDFSQPPQPTETEEVGS